MGIQHTFSFSSPAVYVFSGASVVLPDFAVSDFEDEAAELDVWLSCAFVQAENEQASIASVRVIATAFFISFPPFFEKII